MVTDMSIYSARLLMASLLTSLGFKVPEYLHITIVCTLFNILYILIGDILLHCGDFTDLGKEEEVEDFNNWIGELPYKHKIVIAGNHELSFDPSIVARARESKLKKNWYR